MTSKVSFGVSYMCYATQEIDLPDYVDKNDEDAVKLYVKNVFPDMPLPNGEFVRGSDEVDYDSIAVETEDEKGKEKAQTVWLFLKEYHSESNGAESYTDIFSSKEKAISAMRAAINDTVQNDDLFCNGEPKSTTVVEDDSQQTFLPESSVRNLTWCAYEDGNYLSNSVSYTVYEKEVL